MANKTQSRATGGHAIKKEEAHSFLLLYCEIIGELPIILCLLGYPMFNAVKYLNEDDRNNGGNDHFGDHITGVVGKGINPNGRAFGCVASPNEDSGKEAAKKPQKSNRNRADRDAYRSVLKRFAEE